MASKVFVETTVPCPPRAGETIESDASNWERTDRNFETFILAMAAYPELQKQAQEEIDRVFGQDEMPHAADEKNLPFLRACLLEVIMKPQA